MAWLIPFSNLTPAQQDAVQMDTRTHKAIIGGPGAGKTLVLLHRLNQLFHRAGGKPSAVRLFVYTKCSVSAKIAPAQPGERTPSGAVCSGRYPRCHITAAPCPPQGHNKPLFRRERCAIRAAQCNNAYYPSTKDAAT